jgi:hypothetical protein
VRALSYLDSKAFANWFAAVDFEPGGSVSELAPAIFSSALMLGAFGKLRTDPVGRSDCALRLSNWLIWGDRLRRKGEFYALGF